MTDASNGRVYGSASGRDWPESGGTEDHSGGGRDGDGAVAQEARAVDPRCPGPDGDSLPVDDFKRLLRATLVAVDAKSLPPEETIAPLGGIAPAISGGVEEASLDVFVHLGDDPVIPIQHNDEKEN